MTFHKYFDSVESIFATRQFIGCGNSVIPPIPKAIVRANFPEICKGGGFAEQAELLKEYVV